jgi:hypothetical protein
MNKKKSIGILVAIMAIVVLAVGATVAFAQDGDLPFRPEGAPDFGPGFHGRGGRGGFGGQIDHQALLADALGISVETLENAQAAVKETVLNEAVAAGLLTQEQADAILEGDRPGLMGHPGKGPRGGFGEDLDIDPQALLADELGISVETLQEAQDAAKEAGLAQAIEEGWITEDEADLIQAKQALKDYIDKETLMAEALGISVEDLEAAKEDGTRIRDLVEELGLDMETVRENLEAAHQAAIEAAVEDGVITQEQADQLGEFDHKGPRGHGPGRGFGGRGFPGAPGFGRGQPDTNGATAPAFDA